MDAPDTTFDRDRGLLNTPPSPPMRVDRHSEAISGPAMGGSLVNLVDNTTGDVRDGSPASPGRNDLGDSATDRHRLSPPCGARAAVPLHDYGRRSGVVGIALISWRLTVNVAA